MRNDFTNFLIIYSMYLLTKGPKVNFIMMTLVTQPGHRPVSNTLDTPIVGGGGGMPRITRTKSEVKLELTSTFLLMNPSLISCMT